MPFSVDVNREKKLLYVVGEGRINTADIDAYYPSLEATAHVRICTKALIDLSGEGVSLKEAAIKHIRLLGLRFKHAPLLPENTKMAIVVRSTLAFGFVRLFMAARGERVAIRPFKNMQSALLWLNISDADIPQTVEQAQA